MTHLTEAGADQRQIDIRIPKVLVYLFWTAVGIGVFIGLLFLWVAATTGPAAAAADRFFGSIIQGDLRAAYDMASADFRQEQSEERFALEIATLGPTKFQPQPWRERTLQRDGFSFLRGTLETKSGKTVDFTAQMLKEDDGWKVLALTDRARLRVGPGAWFRQVPAESVLRAMAKKTLLDLNEAVQARDFNRFYDKIPGTWRLNIKVSTIAGHFDKLVEDKVDFAEIADLEAVFDRPPGFYDTSSCGAFGGGCRRSQTGDLVLAGHYPLGSGVLNFELVYRYRHPDWTLACDVERQCIVSVEQ